MVALLCSKPNVRDMASTAYQPQTNGRLQRWSPAIAHLEATDDFIFQQARQLEGRVPHDAGSSLDVPLDRE